MMNTKDMIKCDKCGQPLLIHYNKQCPPTRIKPQPNISDSNNYEEMPIAKHQFRNIGVNKNIQSNICELCFKQKENKIHEVQ